MNLIHAETGGRPRHNDDLLLIQDQTYKSMTSILTAFEVNGGQGFVLTGMVPNTNGIISPGVLFLNGEFLEFDGATGVTFPAVFGIKEELTDNMQYLDGNSKPTRKRRFASLAPDADFTKSYTMTTTNYREFHDIILNGYGNQSIDGNKNFRNEIILKGINVYDRLVNLTNDLAAAITNLTNLITQRFNTVNQTIATLQTYVDNGFNSINAAITNLTNTKQTKVTTKIPWTNLVLDSSFTSTENQNDPNRAFFGPAQYMRSEAGIVYLRGYLRNSQQYSKANSFGGSLIGTLPVSCAPAQRTEFQRATPFNGYNANGTQQLTSTTILINNAGNGVTSLSQDTQFWVYDPAGANTTFVQNARSFQTINLEGIHWSVEQ